MGKARLETTEVSSPPGVVAPELVDGLLGNVGITRDAFDLEGEDVEVSSSSSPHTRLDTQASILF